MRNKLWILVALCALALMVACGGGKQEAASSAGQSAPTAGTPSAPTAATPAADTGNSTVSGKATYNGPDPDTAIAMNADPVCAGLHKEPVDTSKVVVKGGNLANVFVYVKTGLEGKSFPVPTEKAMIDQQGCLYHPRIQGVRVGQTLVIRNSDPTLHNIHALPVKNQEFNQGQPFQKMEFEKKFDKPEVMVHFKCDVHPWMTAYMGVLDHPFFAVTNEDGTFTIPKLPAGKYTLEAWHEYLGTVDQDVTVTPGQTVTANFDFKPKP
ncbi:MAG TPA: carboxypeptidase regulatory-like domain-containing protein [Thermoanaerobaculia bacterium]|nr:carboxypeptidase regulatory-like domain-containing protein [Thermoanaerobaculia bacterium]